MIWRRIVRPILFRMDAEQAHNLMIRVLMAYGWLMWPLVRPRTRDQRNVHRED